MDKQRETVQSFFLPSFLHGGAQVGLQYMKRTKWPFSCGSCCRNCCEYLKQNVNVWIQSLITWTQRIDLSAWTMVRWYFSPFALPTFKFRLACLWSISQEGTINLKWFTKWRKTGINALCWEKCAHIHGCLGVAGKPMLHPLQHRVKNCGYHTALL